MSLTKKILIVEDDPFAVQAMCDKLMAETNYECRGIGTKKMAMELIKKEMFDIIISEYSLQDGTGIEILEAVRTD